jgi:DNA-binding MarR family transcriptional regulator
MAISLDPSLIDQIDRFKTLETIYWEECQALAHRSIFALDDLSFLEPSKPLRELLILQEIEKDGGISQSRLAERIGVVPAQINTYIKNFRTSGLVEMGGRSHRKVIYRLTNRGRLRMLQLRSDFHNEILRLFKKIRVEFDNKLIGFLEEGIQRVVFFGAGEAAELILSRAEELGFDVLAIVDSDPAKQGTEFLGKVVQAPNTINSIKDLDGVIITSLSHRDEISGQIKGLLQGGLKVREI